MSCGGGCRCGLDPVLLWLWCRPVATAPIHPLAWEPSFVTGVALKRPKKKKKESGSESLKLKCPVFSTLSCMLFMLNTFAIRIRHTSNNIYFNVGFLPQHVHIKTHQQTLFKLVVHVRIKYNSIIVAFVYVGGGERKDFRKKGLSE